MGAQRSQAILWGRVLGSTVLLAGCLAMGIGLFGCKGVHSAVSQGAGGPYCTVPKTAQVTWDEAERLRGQGKLELALERYRQLTMAHPRFVPALIQYQDLALAVGGPAADAMRAYSRERAAQHPKDPVAQHGQMRIAPDLAGRVRGLSDLVERYPGYYCAHLDLARQYRSVDRYSEAIRSYRAALAIQAGWFMAHQELAELLVATGRAREAEPHLRLVLDLRPEDDRVREQLAELLIYQLDKPGEAAPLVDELLKRQPNDLHLLLHRAAIQWRKGELLAARDTYLEVLRRDGDRVDAALNLANLYFEPLAQRGEGGRKKWWPKARAAILYFLEREESGADYQVMDRTLTAPYRLKLIQEELGEPGPEGPIALKDLM